MTKTKKLCDNVWVHEINSTKFKMNKISIYFINPIDPEKASLNAALSLILKKQCKAFPSTIALGQKLKELYGAELKSDCTKFGDLQINSFSVSVLADEFALSREHLLEEAFNLLLEIIFKPNFDDTNQFNSTDVKIEKQNLVELIKNELSDKIKLAIVKAKQLMFKNQACSCHPWGSIEKANQITAESLTKAYNEFLGSSQIHLVLNGHGSFDKIQMKFQNIISKIDRTNLNQSTLLCSKQFKLSANFSLTDESETDEILQSNLVMCFATEQTIDPNFIPAIKTMSTLFGGTPTSKLFKVVREKLSYCYYCSSNFDSGKGVIWVISALDKTNLDSAKKEINNQLNELQNGNFSEQDLKETKLALISLLKESSDNLDYMENMLMTNILQNNQISLDEKIEQFENITKNDIIKAANLFSNTLVFTLLNK